MSITYEEALGTLTSMFTIPWTEDSLDAVLRHFEGHMENTVDAVLSHGDADPAILVNRLEASQSGTTMEDMDAQLARKLSFSAGAPEGFSAAHSTTNFTASHSTTNNMNTFPAPAAAQSNPSSTKMRGTPTALPPDFLRISGTVNSVSEDEALARMLQDELFSEELRNNPEFAHLARGKKAERNGALASQKRQNDINDVMKSLSEMTEGAKRRLTMLGQNIRNRIDKSSNQNQHPGYRTIGETKGLLDIHEDDDDQEITFDDSQSNSLRNPDYEMKPMGFAMKKHE